MAHEDEQEYEASINYNTVDHTATIAIVNQMVKCLRRRKMSVS